MEGRTVSELQVSKDRTTLREFGARKDVKLFHNQNF